MKSSSYSTLPAAIFGAGVAIFLESLRYYRNDEWVGAQAYEWVYVPLGFVVYALLFAVVGIALHFFLSKQPPMLQGFAHVLVGGVMFAAVFVVLTPVRAIYLAAWVGVFVAAAVWAAVIIARRPERYGGALVCAGVALVVCGGCTEIFHRATIFFDQRALIALGFTGALVVGPMLFVARLLTARGTVTLAIVVFAAAYGLRVVDGVNRRAALPLATAESPAAVLFVCDTLRADFTSVYGGKAETPTLQSLADEGVLFAKHRSLAPWTVPAMHALLSSNYPAGMDPEGSETSIAEAVTKFRVPESVPTLAEMLSENDYYSAAFVGNPLLDNGDGLLRGFDLTRSVTRDWKFHHRKVGLMTRTPFLHDLVGRVAPEFASRVFTDHTPMMTYLARRFCSLYEGRRYFLWVHFMDPHGPYTPPPAFAVDTNGWPHAIPYAAGQRSPLTEEQRGAIAGYLGEITYVDDALGRVLESMGDDAMSRTVVTVTSDHGEEFWDHGGTGHGRTMFDEVLHVPWILAGPGIERQRVDAGTSAIDLMPTLAGALGLETPGEWRGYDLGPMLRGEHVVPSPTFAQSNYLGAPLQAAVRDEVKLVREVSGGSGDVFVLTEDPHELAPETDNAMADELNGALDDWSASFPSTISQVEGTVSPEEAAEREEQLRSLGYID